MLRILQKWSLALSVIPIMVLVAILKYIYHAYDLEVLPVSPFMSGLIAATIFLLGFLICRSDECFCDRRLVGNPERRFL